MLLVLTNRIKNACTSANVDLDFYFYTLVAIVFIYLKIKIAMSRYVIHIVIKEKSSYLFSNLFVGQNFPFGWIETTVGQRKDIRTNYTVAWD